MPISSYCRCGANLDAENVTHITPLIMAAQYGCTNTLQCLMDLVEQPTRSVFKVLEMEVDHSGILKVCLFKPLVWDVILGSSWFEQEAGRF